MPRTDAHLDDPVLAGFPLQSGFRIVPPTIIIERLGEGAAAVVYRARHYNLDTDVAIKVLRKDVAANNPDLVARFQREAKLAAQIRSENLLAVLDTTDYNGTHYTVMELVDGESVEGRVQRRGPLTVAEALTVTLHTAKGLAALHRKKVVHRDIKPSNIILSRAGSTKLADLGIAKQHEQFDTLATHANAILGTPQYMAPELFENASNAGERSDVYALGLTLAFMLTGEHQHMGKSLPEIIRAVCDGEAFDLSKLDVAVSDDLCVLVNRMTAQRVDERPSTQEVLQLLSPVLLEVGGQAELADPQANSAFGTNDIPSRLDRDRISEIRAAMSTGFGPQYPATVAESGGYTPTVAESGPQPGAVRIPADLQADNRPPAPPTMTTGSGGRGKWLVLAVVLLFFLLIASIGGVLGAGQIVHGDYLAYTGLGSEKVTPTAGDDPADDAARAADQAAADAANAADTAGEGDGDDPDQPDDRSDPPVANQPPVISAIGPQTVVAGQTLGPIQFRVTDDRTPTDKLVLRFKTDKVNVLPSSLIKEFGQIGGGEDRAIIIETIPNTAGQTTVTVSAKDLDGATGQTTFELEITPVAPTRNTPPTLAGLPEAAQGKFDTMVLQFEFTLTDQESPDDIAVRATSSNTSLIPSASARRDDANRTKWWLTLVANPAASGESQIDIVATDKDGERATHRMRVTINREPPMSQHLADAQALAKERRFEPMLDKLLSAARQAKTFAEIRELRDVSEPLLRELRAELSDPDQRERLIPGLRSELLTLAEVTDGPTARLLIVETILRYKDPPYGVQLVGVRDVTRIQDFGLALSNAVEAAEGGEVEAMVYAGDILTQHQAGGPNRRLADVKLGATYLQRGADQNHVPAMARLGIYLRQAAVQRPEGDRQRAILLNDATSLLQRAANAGHAAAAHEYAIYLLNYANDQNAGLRYLRQAARAGYPPAVAGAKQLGISY